MKKLSPKMQEVLETYQTNVDFQALISAVEEAISVDITPWSPQNEVSHDMFIYNSACKSTTKLLISTLRGNSNEQ